ncbi:MAG: RimK family alpha-L-glutamate ligase [Candidatus Berkiellales bacterium]
MTATHPIQIGWEEWVALPELKLPAIQAKVDTGAKTSALHAFMVEKIIEDDNVKVRFGIHPIPDRPEIEVFCTAHLVDEREVTSSNGQTELRYVIRTMVQFGKQKWPIEITLTDRETMAYRMLIGRSAMEGKLLVVPGESFILGTPSATVYDHIAAKRQKRRLNLCILSRSRSNYSTDRLATVAENHGHKVEVVNTTRCYVDIGSTTPTLHYQGKLLPHFDAVIPRIGPSITFYGVAILRQFESLGIFCLNHSSAIANTRDRLFAHQLLGRAGVAMPTTAFAHYPGDIKDMIKIVGGAPLVIKLLGAGSKEVVLAETNKAAAAVMQAFRGLEANFIAQEYVKEHGAKDIRCIVLGNKVIAAVAKGPDKPLSKAIPIKLSSPESKLAVRAARILGLKFAEVNLLRTKEGPRVIDVDPSASLRLIERISNCDIASLVVEYIETHARPRLPKRVVGFRP